MRPIGFKNCTTGSSLNNVLSPVKIPEPGNYTIFVDQYAIGNNDGTSWNNAFTSLSDALNSASPGDLIGVKPGRYQYIYKSSANDIEIRSTNGADVTFIDGYNSHQCAYTSDACNSNNLLINGFSLINGYSSSENGAILAYVRIKNCILRDGSGKCGMRNCYSIENCDIININVTPYSVTNSGIYKNVRIMNCSTSGTWATITMVTTVNGVANYITFENVFCANNKLTTSSDTQSAYISSFYSSFDNIRNCTFIDTQSNGYFFSRVSHTFHDCVFYLTNCKNARSAKNIDNCVFNITPPTNVTGSFIIDDTMTSDFIIPQKQNYAYSNGQIHTHGSTDIRGLKWKSNPSIGAYQG